MYFKKKPRIIPFVSKLLNYELMEVQGYINTVTVCFQTTMWNTKSA